MSYPKHAKVTLTDKHDAVYFERGLWFVPMRRFEWIRQLWLALLGRKPGHVIVTHVDRGNGVITVESER